MKIELEAIYDKRKFFYGKATVNIENGIHNLFSYGVKICKYDENTGEFHLQAGVLYSQTTCRHLREFLKQRGITHIFNKMTMAEFKEKQGMTIHVGGMRA